jgi:hypothetical protein
MISRFAGAPRRLIVPRGCGLLSRALPSSLTHALSTCPDYLATKPCTALSSPT